MSLPEGDRLAVEQELLEAVRAAQEGYHRAAAEHRKVLDARRAGHIELNPDGSQLLYETAHAERYALAKYSMAVKAFADAVLQRGEPSANPAQRSELTSRERQVLELIASGLSSKQVAFELGISFRTAVCHRYRIMQKLRVHDVAGLVQYAIRSGTIRRGESVCDGA
jgi:DNA-binding NarL/FixJ family response regulator